VEHRKMVSKPAAHTANSLFLLSILGTAANRRRVRNELNKGKNSPSAE